MLNMALKKSTTVTIDAVFHFIFPMLLLLVMQTSCAQEKPVPLKSAAPLEDLLVPKVSPPPNELPPESIATFLHTEQRVPGPGGDVLIENSYPKGGWEIDGVRGYYNDLGRHHGYGIFWTQVTNGTDTPVELHLEFPADSFPLPPPDAFYKLYLSDDTMSLAKATAYNYGITGLKDFLDAHYYHRSRLHRTLAPGEAITFYTTMLLHVPHNGRVRTGLFAREGVLHYRADIAPFGVDEFTCGRLRFDP